MRIYKKAHEIFDKWEQDKTYELGLYHLMSGKYDIMKMYAKDIDEARRLANYWISDNGKRKEGWQVKYVLLTR